MNNEDITEDITIDSLSFRMPYKLVEVLNANLTDEFENYKINNTTGEMQPILHKFKQAKHQKLLIEKHGIKYIFQIQKSKIGGNYMNTLFININSKMLKSRYLEGITNKNIGLIYNELMELKVAKFSYKHFLLNSTCTGIEFKKDFMNKDFLMTIMEIENKIKNSSKKYKDFTKKKSTSEQRLTFTQRTKSTPSKPFVSIYNKELELNSRSGIFTHEYLYKQDTVNLRRIEFSVKNINHANKLGLTETTLNYLLNLSQDKKREMLRNCVNQYIDRPSENKTKSKISPINQILVNSIKILMKQNNSFFRVTEYLLEDFEDRKQRSKKRKHLEELYLNHIKDVEVIELTTEEKNYGLIGRYFEMKKSA